MVIAGYFINLNMSILVNIQNEQEEKVLLAFLDSLHYKYQAHLEENTDQINNAFLDQYNKEIDQADADIEAGNYVKHTDVEEYFQKRRNAL